MQVADHIPALDFPAGWRVLAAGQNSSGECGLGLQQHVVREFRALTVLGGARCRVSCRGARRQKKTWDVVAACGGASTLIYDEDCEETLACGEQGSDGSRHTHKLAVLPSLSAVRIRSLASGLSHSLAICEAGVVLAWGRNSSGQCGACLDRFNIGSPTPVSALQNSPALGICCGAYHSLVIVEQLGAPSTSAGRSRLVAFGWNNFGQLGISTAAAQEAGQEPEEGGWVDGATHHVALPQFVRLPSDEVGRVNLCRVPHQT